MAEKRADQWQPETCSGPDGRVRMAKIVDRHITDVHLGPPVLLLAHLSLDSLPRLRRIRMVSPVAESIPAAPHDHPWTTGLLGCAAEELRGGRAEHDGLRSGLRVRQVEYPVVKVDVLPFKREYLRQPAPGEHQQSEEERDMGGYAVLRSALHRSKRIPKTGQLADGEVPLPLLLLVPL